MSNSRSDRPQFLLLSPFCDNVWALIAPQLELMGDVTIACLRGQIAIDLRRLTLCAPISLDHIDRSSSIFRPARWIFVFHCAQSAGATVALIGGSILALNCCAVITIATEPIIRAAAIKVRMVKVSPAKAAPSKTATIGLT